MIDPPHSKLDSWQISAVATTWMCNNWKSPTFLLNLLNKNYGDFLRGCFCERASLLLKALHRFWTLFLFNVSGEEWTQSSSEQDSGSYYWYVTHKLMQLKSNFTRRTHCYLHSKYVRLNNMELMVIVTYHQSEFNLKSEE